jgi:TolB-like protein
VAGESLDFVRRRTRQPVAPPRLSLVVVPFDNFSDRRDHHYFAHRMTDGLTTDLSRFTGMRVVSRSTALTYRSKPVGAKQIGRELDVRYVLEGSVQPSANHVRVNARLIDAGSDTHLWAERFGCDPSDQFGIQNEITKRSAVGLYAELLRAEASQATEHPDAAGCILQGRAAKLKPLERDDYADAISLLEKALALDPHSAEAQGWLADSLASRALDEWPMRLPPTSLVRQDWLRRLSRHRRAARLRILRKAGCSPRRADTRRLSPNMRPPARSIPAGRILTAISASAGSGPVRWQIRSRLSNKP